MPQAPIIQQIRSNFGDLFKDYSDEELLSIVKGYQSKIGGERELTKLLTPPDNPLERMPKITTDEVRPTIKPSPSISSLMASGVGKAWDWANTPLAPEFGGPESGFISSKTDPLTGEESLARKPIGEAITTPLAIAGEAIPAMGAIRGLRQASRASRLSKFGRGADEAAEVLKIGPSGEVVSVGKAVEEDALTKLNRALEEILPIRKEQEAIYTEERARKIFEAKDITTPGEKGFKERMGALRGEHTKLEGIELRTKLEQSEVNELFDRIQAAPLGDQFTKLHAGTGLAKLLDGQIPQMSELKVLGKIFGDEFLAKAVRGMTLADKKQSLVSEVVNLPRSIMASWDFSAPLRQGLPLITKKAFWTSFDDMFKSWGSEKGFKAVIESIENDPLYGFAMERKLNLTDLGPLRGREEQFMSTWSEVIPLVRRSNRAYVGFLDKLRFDTFKSLIGNAEKMGLRPMTNEVLSNNIAKFVNTSTGRGSLGALERHAILLNSTLFAPRLIASRLQMLNPYYYYKLDPFTRKEALKALFSVVGAGSAVGGLGAAVGGEVELNPTSSDFGKIKIGDVRLDPYAGFQQYAVAASKLISGQQKSSVSGRSQSLTGGGAFSQNRWSVLSRFGEQKLNPVVTFAIDMLRGTSVMGQPVELPDAVMNRVLPILVQDIIELAQEDPKMLPILIPGAFGMGVTSYGRRMEREPYSPAMDLIRKTGGF